jgi:PadR family transcriptional regulator, regulatory protein PadR
VEPLTRVTSATLDVLDVLLANPGADMWGLEIVKHTGRPTGSVYPILDRLEQSGWVESEWEHEQARRGARRRLYRLTAPGAAEAVRLLAERRKPAPVHKPLAAQ